MPDKPNIYNTAQQLMAGRLFGSTEVKLPPHQTERLGEMALQLIYAGGPAQQSRMIRDKRKTLNRALLYSYQAAWIRKVPPEGVEYMEGDPEGMTIRALINPDKLKMDYDDKILSVGFEHKFKPGDVFEWLNTGTYWLVRLQNVDELAYFRGDIRRCNYTIKWEDEKGNVHSTYAAIRGPVETKINYIQKHQISVDTPNHSLNIYMPKNKDTLAYFKRYSKFYLQEIEEGDTNICWRVEANDSISTPGILEVTAVEYYANEMEDDMEKGVAGALKVKHIEQEITDTVNMIVGDTFIKPKTDHEYTFNGSMRLHWYYDTKLPIEVMIDQNDMRHIKLRWIANYSGQFELKYGDFSKTIVVESLF